MLSGDMNGEAKKTRKRPETKRRLPITDLEIANNPYPVYKLMLNSERFTKKALIETLEHLSQFDVRLKYTKQKTKTVLEEAILRICRT
jgi:DNA polymerase III delta subunit